MLGMVGTRKTKGDGGGGNGRYKMNVSLSSLFTLDTKSLEKKNEFYTNRCRQYSIFAFIFFFFVLKNFFFWKAIVALQHYVQNNYSHFHYFFIQRELTSIYR